MMTEHFLGLDLSLRKTGWAVYSSDNEWLCGHWEPEPLVGIARLDWLATQLETLISKSNFTSAMIENYAFGSAGRSHSTGEWGGIARLILSRAGIPVCTIPPTSLKLLATGKGDAKKSLMKTKAIVLGAKPNNQDQADAVWLARAAWLEFTPGAITRPREADGLESVKLFEPVRRP